jgi:hypothetical protein
MSVLISFRNTKPTTKPKTKGNTMTKAKTPKKQKHLHHQYRGVTIWRNTTPGYALRWNARTEWGPVSADTLAGIRELIR